MGKFHVTAIGLKQILTDAIDPAGSELAAVAVRAYQDVVGWTKDTVIGDITECTFGGYAEINPVLWSHRVGPAGVPYLAGPTLTLGTTGAGLPQSVGGWYLVGDPGGAEYLIGGYSFNAPVDLLVAGNSLISLVDLMLDEITLSLPGVCL